MLARRILFTLRLFPRHRRSFPTRRSSDLVIIGAGQAGLSAAYHLQRRGVDCLVLDGIARIGHQWRNRYDSLRLFTPAYADGRDGLRVPGEQQICPSKDELADSLELYALTHELPVRLRSTVRWLTTGADGGYVVKLEHDGQHERITSKSVIIATGTFGQEPNIPRFAEELAATIHQVHSIRYHKIGRASCRVRERFL